MTNTMMSMIMDIRIIVAYCTSAVRSPTCSEPVACTNALSVSTIMTVANAHTVRMMP